MRTGIYIDFDNIASNGLGSISFKALREHFEGCGRVTQLHAYLSYDEDGERNNQKFGAWRRGCRSRLEQAGFMLHMKTPKSYQGSDGEVTTKANVDVDLTVDVMLHSERLDRVVLMSGDGDFVRLVRALQDKGIWVDVAAFQGVSDELSRACNALLNPLLIPGAHYSPDYSFKRVFRVTGFNLREMTMSIEYLDAAPKSLSPDDPAWQREEVRVSRDMYESRRFTPGKILAWTGANGLSAYRDIA
jgi:uncharacterized LabA/DUF88 family protein